MTGHGAASAALGDMLVEVDIRCVNHRFVDTRVRGATALLAHTARLEDLLRRRLRRGRIEAQVAISTADASPAPQLDEVRARAAYAQLVRLRDELCPGEPVPLSLLQCVPDLFTQAPGPPETALRSALITAAEQACDHVWSMRRTEGDALRTDLIRHRRTLEASLKVVQTRAPMSVARHRERLRARIAEWVDLRTHIQPERLEQEVALVADRTDISEEIARLSSHLAQLDSLLGQAEPESEPRDGSPLPEVGKRLDFLLQEMHRETQTIGAKSADAAIAQEVIDMKSALHRMREQAANVF